MNVLNKGIIASITTMGFSIALGADVAELTTNWAASLNGIKVVLVLGATVAGLAMMAAGAVQLKKHGENPQQVPLNRPLIFLASGALAFGLGATSNTLQSTIFGEEGSRTSEANMEEEFSM